MTAQISKTVTASLPVEYSQFALFDYFGDASTSNLDRPAKSDWVGCSGHGGAVFHASDQSITVHVELELWSGQPPLDETTLGLRTFEGRFTTDSGRVILASLTGSPSDITVELPTAGPCMARAINHGPSVNEDGRQNEKWQLQVWPSSE